MTLILPQLNKLSKYTDNIDEKEHRRMIDQDLQRLFVGLRPSLVSDLTDEATVTIDASIAFHFRLTLGGNRTIANPTNGRDGQDILIELVQDATGGRTVTWGSEFSFSDDITEPTLSTTAGAIDLLLFLRNSPNAKWMCIGVSRGYV